MWDNDTVWPLSVFYAESSTVTEDYNSFLGLSTLLKSDSEVVARFFWAEDKLLEFWYSEHNLSTLFYSVFFTTAVSF